MRDRIAKGHGTEWRNVVTHWERFRVFGLSFEKAFAAYEAMWKALTGRPLERRYLSAKSVLRRALERNVPYLDAYGDLIGKTEVEGKVGGFGV